jgi:hypothetical protein
MGVCLIQSNVSNFAFNMFDGMVWIATVLGLVLNFASKGFRHKQMLEVFLINSAGRGMKKTWNHGDQALGAAGNTL